jgi:chemotaxis protein histidine kinase CheA
MKTFHSKSDSNSRKLWDKERVRNFCKVLSEDVYKKITTDFFEKNNRIDILIEAINSDQTKLILKECHSLRGASTMIGLVAFNDIIDTIEQSSKNQSLLNKNEIIGTLNKLLRESKNQFLKLT